MNILFYKLFVHYPPLELPGAIESVQTFSKSLFVDKPKFLSQTWATFHHSKTYKIDWNACFPIGFARFWSKRDFIDSNCLNCRKKVCCAANDCCLRVACAERKAPVGNRPRTGARVVFDRPRGHKLASACIFLYAHIPFDRMRLLLWDTNKQFTNARSLPQMLNRNLRNSHSCCVVIHERAEQAGHVEGLKGSRVEWCTLSSANSPLMMGAHCGLRGFWCVVSIKLTPKCLSRIFYLRNFEQII